ARLAQATQSWLGFCLYTIAILLSLNDALPISAASWNNGHLQLSFLSDPPDKTDVLTIEKDIVLDSATSRALGYEQVTVKAGTYPVGYTTNPNCRHSPTPNARSLLIKPQIPNPT